MISNENLELDSNQQSESEELQNYESKLNPSQNSLSESDKSHNPKSVPSPLKNTLQFLFHIIHILMSASDEMLHCVILVLGYF